MSRLRHLSGAIAVALVFSASAHATQFSKVVVFGDSLSDDGNISLAQAPGVQPPLRFTTNPGQTAVELVAAHYGDALSPSLLGGSDYAWGGAGVNHNSPGVSAAIPTLTAQIEGYLAAGPSVDPDALYTVWGGANDILYHATAVGAGAVAQQVIAQTIAGQVAQAQLGGLPDSQVPAFVAQITPIVTAQVNAAVAAGAGVSALESSAEAQGAIAVAAQQEVTLIGKLQAAGVKNIVVFNLPNIGITPSGAAQGAAGAAGLTGLSTIFNSQLNSGVGQLGVGIIPVNTYALLNEIIGDPSTYGLSNVTQAACTTASSITCTPATLREPNADQTYLFADGVHPTTAAHAILAQVVLSEINAPGQASLLSEAPLASAAAHMRTVRNQMHIDNRGGDARVFSAIDYGHQRFDATVNSPKASSNNVNLTVGVDGKASESVNIGIALGISRNNLDVANGGGGFTLNSVLGSAYAVYHRDGAYIGGHVGFAQLDYNDIQRGFSVGAAHRVEAGRSGGSQLLGGLNVGWEFGSDSLRNGPFAGIEWQRVRVNGYEEYSEDSTAMWYGKQERTAAIATLGWRLSGTWQAGRSALRPFAELAFNHDSNADPTTVRAGLTSLNGSFALPGYVPDDSWVSANIGLSADFSDHVSGWLAYNGRFADDSQKLNSLNLGLKIAF